MSKWINNKKFEKFKESKKEEKANASDDNGTGNFFLKWKNPTPGTQDSPKEYRIRLLPDKNQDFYTKYYYHFFQTDDKTKTYYIKCPKTDNFSNFCPWCFINQQLWKGNKSDKEKANRYKRNVRFAVNAFIRHDPRDSDVKDEERKVTGKVRLYEFPATLEKKISNELTNEEEGYGVKIFDPEEGNDFVISVASKPPDKNGNVWPDYTLTQFSRKQNSIADSEEEVKEIMENVYDLSEYLEKMSMNWESHEKLLKEEMVWDYVEDVFKKNVKKSDNDEEKSTKSKNIPENDENHEKSTESEETSVNSENSENDDNCSEEDLVEELKNL